MITYEQYVKMLPVAKNRLDDELEIQSETLHQIGERVAEAALDMANAKEALDAIDAELFLEFTDKNSANKMTKDQADAAVILESDHKGKWTAYQRAKNTHTKWQGLYEAWKARGFDIKVLGQLYTDQYFAIDSAGQSNSREHYQRDRDRAAESRRTRRSVD